MRYRAAARPPHAPQCAAALHAAFNAHQPRANGDAAITFKAVGPNDNIAGAGFIFQRQKHHAFGTARTLATNHQTGNGDAFAIGGILQA